jgi:hypothetical protein
MALPVHDVTMPISLSGQSNGKLAADRLVDTAGQAGGPVVRLCRPAYRAWRAMCAAAKSAGHIFKAVSYYDSYRPYSVQETIFKQRYRRVGYETAIWWDGSYWVHHTGAVAAIPGTSNHGWALAVDIGEEKDGDSGTESIDQGSVDWLVRNAWRYGFSAEVQSEPWHWRYYAGDDVPQAVLDYEGGEVAGYGFATQEQANDVWRRTGSMQRILTDDVVPRLEAIKQQLVLQLAILEEIRTTVEAIEPGEGGSFPAFPWTVTFEGNGTVTS